MNYSQVEWDIDTVRRFWEYEVSRSDQSNYFTYQVGKGIVNLLEQFLSFEALKVLDYGSGPGYLLEELLQRRAYCAAVDFSPEAIEFLEKKFSDSSYWLGAKVCSGESIPFCDRHFDVVICAETIEHILDEHLEITFEQINRILVPNGIAIFTTPNDEKLERSMIYCAKCNTEFHRWQHLRSWNSVKLRDTLNKFGFEEIVWGGLNLKKFMPNRPNHFSQWSLGYLYYYLKTEKNVLLDRLQNRKLMSSRVFKQKLNTKSKPHLVGIFRKR